MREVNFGRVVIRPPQAIGIISFILLLPKLLLTEHHGNIVQMMDIKRKNILVTGGSGFLGSWVVEKLKKEGVKKITIPRSSKFDLREKNVCFDLVRGQDVIIHLAADVGGIGLNEEHPGKLFYDNASMGINLLEAARVQKVEKVVIIGTACSYAKYSPIPFREEDFWLGFPDEITGVYGMAKKMLLVQLQAYKKEYGLNSIYLILVNLYGPGDNFDPKYGHVIPSLINRMIEAKNKKQKKFSVWGTGSATREFLYAEDAARGIILALKNYNDTDPVNLGTGKEISIKDLVMLLSRIVKFDGEIVWDITKPDGQPRRCLDTTRAFENFGFRSSTSLEMGLKKTVDWYLRHKKI